MQHRFLPFALVGGAAVPILIFAGVMIVLFDRQQEHAAQDMFRQFARGSMAAVDRQLSAQLASLGTFAAAVDPEDAGNRAFIGQARRLLSRSAGWLAISLVGTADGRTRIDVLQPQAADLPETSDPRAVALIAAGGEPIVGAIRARPPGGAGPHVLLHVPVSDGQVVTHVLTAAVLASAYAETLGQQDIPEGWAVTLLDHERSVVARTRQHEHMAAAPAVLQAELDKGSDHVFLALGQAGAQVRMAIARSQSSGWTVAVGAPAAPVQRALRRTLWTVIGGGVLSLLLALALTGLLFRSFGRRQKAEQRLLAFEARDRAERRLADVAANVPGIIYQRVRDPQGRVSYPYMSDGPPELTDARRAGAHGSPPADPLVPHLAEADRQRWNQAIDDAARDGSALNVEVRIDHPDGGVRWLRNLASTHREADGSIVWDGVLLDITDVRRARAELEASLAEKATLFREIHHRVKNNMQVISSLIQLEARRIGGAQARERLDMVAQRISVMGRIHDQLYRSERLTAVDFGQHLKQLAEGMRVHRRDDPPVEIEIFTEHLLCNLEIALPLGLVAHELLANSIKHAFPAHAPGYVQIVFRRFNAEREVELAISDSGRGLPPAAAGSSSGLGLQLVRALAEQAGGTLDFGTGCGTRVRVVLPSSHFI